MEMNLLLLLLLLTKPGGQRGRDQTKSRRIYGVEKKARILGCRNWLTAAQGRGR
jgi:hypothetical protein